MPSPAETVQVELRKIHTGWHGYRVEGLYKAKRFGRRILPAKPFSVLTG